MQYGQTQLADGRTQVGVYGWRKRCLYALLLGLAVVVMCSFVATLLIINILYFNMEGLGMVRVTEDGVELDDTSMADILVSSQISSRAGQPLGFEGDYNLTALLVDNSGKATRALHFYTQFIEPIKHEVVASAARFQVNDLRGRALFSADNNQVSVGADILRVLEGGVDFVGSVQTSMLRSNLGSELMLESATRKISLRAPGGVSIESRAADISVACLNDLQLASSDGTIKLKAPGIYIPNLKSVDLQETHLSRYFQMQPSTPPKAYQMCVCSNGKLFVAHADGECRVDSENSQCR